MFNLVWKALGWSGCYRAFGTFVGAEAFRQKLAVECVQARPGERVLDLGCGPADWLRFLPGVEYVGIDHNAEYIEAARERYGNLGRFEVIDLGDDLAGTYRDFDVVLAMGVLHHLTDAEAGSLLRTASMALRPGGRFVSLDGVITEDQNPLARYLVARDRGRFVRTLDGYERLVRSHFARVTSRVFDGQLRIPYTHLVMRCEQPEQS